MVETTLSNREEFGSNPAAFGPEMQFLLVLNSLIQIFSKETDRELVQAIIIIFHKEGKLNSVIIAFDGK